MRWLLLVFWPFEAGAWVDAAARKFISQGVRSGFQKLVKIMGSSQYFVVGIPSDRMPRDL
jgi:hypothetical protein